MVTFPVKNSSKRYPENRSFYVIKRLSHLMAAAAVSALFVFSFIGCGGGKKEKDWAVDKVELTPRNSLSGKIEDPPMFKKLSKANVLRDKSELDKPFVCVWPLDELDVTSPYGHRRHPVVGTILFHKGVDLAAPRGTPVMSTGPGIVEYAGTLPLTGKTVIIAHRGNFQSLYAHLEEILVWEEMVVDKGAPIGLIGSTGRSTGPHLHFQMNLNGKSVDPTNLLGTVVDPDSNPGPITTP